jgi:hypothetical protein
MSRSWEPLNISYRSPRLRIYKNLVHLPDPGYPPKNRGGSRDPGTASPVPGTAETPARPPKPPRQKYPPKNTLIRNPPTPPQNEGSGFWCWPALSENPPNSDPVSLSKWSDSPSPESPESGGLGGSKIRFREHLLGKSGPKASENLDSSFNSSLKTGVFRRNFGRF